MESRLDRIDRPHNLAKAALPDVDMRSVGSYLDGLRECDPDDLDMENICREAIAMTKDVSGEFGPS